MKLWNNEQFYTDKHGDGKKTRQKDLTIQTGWCLGSILDALWNNRRAASGDVCLYSINARDWRITGSLGFNAWPTFRSFLAFSISSWWASNTPHMCHANLFFGLAWMAFWKKNKGQSLSNKFFPNVSSSLPKEEDYIKCERNRIKNFDSKKQQTK